MPLLDVLKNRHRRQRAAGGRRWLQAGAAGPAGGRRWACGLLQHRPPVLRSMGRIVEARADLIEGDRHVQGLTLVAERDVAQRLDLKPFAAVYVVAPAIVVKVAEGTPEGAPAWVYVASLVAAGALHALCLLACVWSTAVAAALRYVPSASVHDATHVVVQPQPGKGQPTICKVVVREPPSATQREADEAVVTSTTFSYQQRTYVFDHATGQFSRQRAPVDMAIAAYREAKGLGRSVDADLALHRYGKNQCKLPRRDFYSSLLEQLSGPFFVFQVFCVLLWLLDDMWHYALFTGVMLVFFECTVAMTRVRNAEQLYKMEPKAQPVLVWREGKWKDAKSTELLPGDLFAMRRVKTHREDAVCPCDGVIISGACVMNEVKLTGESVPQMKESIASEDGSRKLQLGKSVDKNHVVYAGTKLVMVTAGADENQITTSRIPEPEPGAVLVYALRTGFDTSQGKLMRTILFAADGPVTANSAEAFIFIGGLLVFAVIASTYVLIEGLKDPDRSRWKLFLNCTMILTSVIPPELPMELSLAVNNSLMALMKLGIFCTEPFRIPSAGKVRKTLGFVQW
jgi:cation-transporting ATPase 13A1